MEWILILYTPVGVKSRDEYNNSVNTQHNVFGSCSWLQVLTQLQAIISLQYE